ncbi:MarR family winged helix-turn-helix transcriptional regulator [Streptomyces brasiliensis]|uniref:MarR family winged helix-turn-helix transcriptional regulator n=1 Tax=Streptomyces brasiliensis TaxID=1954 RepID=UPI00166FBA75|nr:MarR family transcriptional regulator [Streptomyces brasiliensis]
MNSRHTQAQPSFRDILHARLVEQGTVPPDVADRTDLVFNLTKFWNRLGQDAESVHRRLGWSWAGFRLMNLLWVAGPLEARHLTRLSGASRAATSAVLNTLERDGLISRDRSESDRRQVLVSLTEEGSSRLMEGLRAQAERDRAWFAVLTPEEQQQLGRLLMRLADQRTP